MATPATNTSAAQRAAPASADGLVAALDLLEELLEELRSTEGLIEKKRGVFYRKSKAFLHFHEDASGLHADVRLGEDFERRRVETGEERAALLALVRSI